MPTVLLPLASLLDPVGAVPRAVEARKWLIPLLLACLATGFSGVAIALRLDASRVVIPELAKSGELAKASEREIDEKIEQTQRVAIVAGVAKAVFLVPLEVLAVAAMLKLLAWLLGKKTEFGALFTVGALTFLPVAVFHLVLGASALRQEVLTISLLAELVPTSLTAVLKDASPGLARWYGAVDVFNLWAAVVLGLGFGAAAKVGPWKGLAAGLVLYVLFAAAFLVGIPGLASSMGGPPS